MKFEDLNDEQKVAVTCPYNMLLTACPGSGKTRVVTHKVAWEIENAAASRKKVVALTYTIRAAEEIEHRLEQAGIESSSFWTGNIHSFCLNWIVRPYASYYAKTLRGFEVIDSIRSDEILKEICAYLKISDKILWDLTMRINPDGSWAATERDMVRILDEYEKRLTEKRLVDFDRILFYAFDLLRQFPKIGRTLSAMFSVILVDEYQDTQELQYQIIFQLIRSGEGKTRVCFFGDPDQAIYGSLGGVAKSKAELEAGLGCTVKHRTLPGNYRSSQRIVNYYRNFQGQNLAIEARGKYADAVGCITFNQEVHTENIVNRLAGIIRNYLAKGIRADEICVLVPQWHLIMSVAGRLRKALPDVSIDATGVGPASGSRDNFFYKLTRLLLAEPSPNTYPRRLRIATELVEELGHYYNDPDIVFTISPKLLLRRCNSLLSAKTDTVEYLVECFAQLLDSLGLVQNSALEECQASYLKGIQRKVNDPRYALPNDIETFRNFFKESNGVIISSCHGVKGEEFEVVIAFGILSDIIPHWKAIKTNGIDHHAASNKLLYVTCSRAKRFLHLIAERERTMGSGRWKRVLTTTPQVAQIKYDYDDLMSF